MPTLYVMPTVAIALATTVMVTVMATGLTIIDGVIATAIAVMAIAVTAGAVIAAGKLVDPLTCCKGSLLSVLAYTK